MIQHLVSLDSLRERVDRLEREYQAVLDAAVDAVIVIDEHAVILSANPAVERLFGYTEEELVGRNVAMLMPEPYRSEHDSHVARYLKTRVPHIIGIGREVSAVRRDGSVFDAELAVGAVDGSGPPRFVGFIRDITRRKENELALARTASELNTAQEMANLGNYLILFDGSGPNYRSPQYCRILGFNPADEPAESWDIEHYLDKAVFPADREQVKAGIESLFKGAASFDLTYRIVRPDGSVRHVHHIAQVARDGRGRTLRHFGTLHDITERQHAEDEVRQMQDRLTHFGRVSTMGEMAAGIAHEINQPLTAIATYAQACQRFLSQSDFDIADITQGLRQIENQALRAGEVIRRLRSFVRNREVRREPLDPNQLLDDLLMLAQTDARHHSVEIQLEPGAGLPEVQADPVQMQQVILNLVRNGIDAMADQPHDRRQITLSVRLNEQEDVEFCVCDRGPGLSESAERELFNPFFTTKPSGTGLGLAISQSIVRAHGGKLWYRPNPAGGAAFCFSLPAAVKGP